MVPPLILHMEELGVPDAEPLVDPDEQFVPPTVDSTEFVREIGDPRPRNWGF